jgi:hypothetical protein
MIINELIEVLNKLNKNMKIESIQPKFYYITEDNPTEKVPLEPQEIINLIDIKLIELVLPKCRRAYCYFNNLTKLIIHDDCEYVDCSDNYLTELIIPKNCKGFNCNRNNLTKLVALHASSVLCSDNNLHPLITQLFESCDPVKIKLANNLQKYYE